MGLGHHAHILRTQTSMEGIETVDFVEGTVCYYTRVSPSKSTGNEDSLAVIPLDGNCGVLAVADGVGGYHAGDFASSMIVKRLSSNLARTDGSAGSCRQAILASIGQSNTDIRSTLKGAASTVTVVQLCGSMVQTHHVGDTEALVTGRKGRIKYRTVPHSPVGEALHAGKIDEEMALQHSQRHLITNAVGMAPMHIDSGKTYELARYDTLLIASDGIYDNLYSEEIVEIIRKGDLETAANSLLALCQMRMDGLLPDGPSKPDDASFILYRRRKGTGSSVNQ